MGSQGFLPQLSHRVGLVVARCPRVLDDHPLAGMAFGESTDQRAQVRSDPRNGETPQLRKLANALPL
jgi:hypothetical protein